MSATEDQDVEDFMVVPTEDPPVIHETAESTFRLPWKQDLTTRVHVGADVNGKPGEFVLQSLFLEFCALTDKKIEQVLAEALERPLSKSLQRGEDTQFDQLLTALGTVAEQCLPSLLRTLYRWYEKQTLVELGDGRIRRNTKIEKDFLCERRDLALEFVYTLVLIEVLPKLSFHPGHEDLITYMITQAFKHFKYRDGLHTTPNNANITIIAELYAEVIGVLAQSRFQAVKKTFLLELRELKLRDQTPYTAQSIISLLMGLKFFRVKMHPIEEFEACVQFLHELGRYFLDVKDRDIKHALAGLFVEILLPVAATAKNEVNVPVLKNFVEMFYSTTIDMTTKKKHTVTLFPLVTCLLCVSHKQFFLNNWPYFLTMCLSQLRTRDPKMSRVALESLYRLLWVYMVRIKCESNTATQSRLQSIVNSLFPKGSRIVTPRDAPLNIFVKIIQFIAKERLDFAMKEIIFDLLCVGRQIKYLTPERMSIGLRAFLVIADTLQQKDGDPPMPQTMATLPSGNTVRHKKTFLHRMLTDTTAKLIGLSLYYGHVLKTFDSILRHLDSQVGRPLLLIKSENTNRDADEMITTERKPKIDLFRTCVATIPRLIPDGMTCQELIEMLSRLTVHVDEELKGLAFQALQNLMSESNEWREHVIRGFVQFIHREIADTITSLLDGALRMMIQLLVQWKATSNIQRKDSIKDKYDTRLDKPGPVPADPKTSGMNLTVLHEVEGLGLVMLCNNRLVTRKLALHMVKEIRTIIAANGSALVCEPCLIDVLDKACPTVVERLVESLPAQEKPVILTCPTIDMTWAIDRSSTVWTPSANTFTVGKMTYTYNKLDSWMSLIAGLVTEEFALTACPHAISYAWPIVFNRLNSLFSLVDPSLLTNENRASILRSGSKKVTTERDMHMALWRNYVVLACAIAQKTSLVPHRCASPDPSSSPDAIDKSDTRPPSSSPALFHLIVPLIKCDCGDMRDSIVYGLGHSNPYVFRDLLDEMVPYLKEANDKKQDNIKRKRKRDLLRVQLARVFEMMSENKAFAKRTSYALDTSKHTLIPSLVDYIDGARQYLEGESDRDLPILHDIRLHFSGFLYHLISNFPLDIREKLLSRDLRYSLFHLFANWSRRFCPVEPIDKRPTKEEVCSELELSAVKAMSAVLCCGQVFDSVGLNDDGYIYNWLDKLLASHDDKIYELAKETVVLLLEYNPDIQGLLDWVIDRCYTGSCEVADGCFTAAVTVFQTREYPCDHIAMLNLSILYIGSPRIHIHELAIQLLHLLDTRFFQEEPIFTTSVDDNPKQPPCLNDIFLSVAYSYSQAFISEQLARLHPELTMPIFSEISHRLQTARPSIRQTLLVNLVPWLHNMELVDSSLPPTNPLNNFLMRLHDNQGDVFKAPLKGEGWGSTQTTEMVLNNLFYMTVKFGDEHPKDIEILWTEMVVGWPNNLKIILRYLVVMVNMATNELLPYAKRVVSYIGRAKPEKLVDELMNELQTVEPLNQQIERTQTPPFYRLLQPVRKATAPYNTTDDEKLNCQTTEPLEKGILHTKRHSTLIVEDTHIDDITVRTETTISMGSSRSSSNSTLAQDTEPNPITELVPPLEEDPLVTEPPRRSESPQPYPLPMPAYGGYFAPMSAYLPETLSNVQTYHRSNIAVMFLSDLVVDGLEIDWSANLPLMLHIIFLGLDHTKLLVYEHCKKLLQNVLLLLASHDHTLIARLLIGSKVDLTDASSLVPHLKDASGDGTDLHSALSQSTYSVDSNMTLVEDADTTISPDPDSFNNVEEAIKTVLSMLECRKGKPMWSYEDITSKTLSIQSADQLAYLLRCTVYVCKELAPMALVEKRWGQIALQLALSCSSRHYAGRSFQVVRALMTRASTQMLSDILSRLVETVAEQGDDMQSYVTEILLTLESTVDYFRTDIWPTDFMRELFMSTPNLTKESWPENRRSAPVTRIYTPIHHRTTSYSAAGVRGKIPSIPCPPDMRHSVIETPHIGLASGDMPRSRSAHSLKNMDQTSIEDKFTILTQMFWITISLLDSDYEYEYVLAMRLLDKILQHLQLDRPEVRDRLDKVLLQIKWPNFPGVQAMLLKGCTCPTQTTYDLAWSILSQLTNFIRAPVVDPTSYQGFPMNVMSVLPYLVANYETPGDTCRRAAEYIAQMCCQLSDRLDNLATVMSLYSRGTFGKDSFQWTKCVVKYLHDVFHSASLNIVTFLVEVMEKGPNVYQSSVLQILHCLLHYIDISQSPANVINSELFQTVTKYIQGSQWKEALKMLKLAVTRSSTLTAAPPSLVLADSMILTTHTSFAEAEISFRKELPGRTLDFSVNMSSVPIIASCYLNPSVKASLSSEATGSTSPVPLSRKPSATNQDSDCGWRRPQASQARTRERLVNLLTCLGQKVGLPKSPSVIFSQSSDTIEHQQSVASSSEEASITDAMSSDALLNEPGSSELLVFKRFDFLNELEENEDDNYNYSSLCTRPQSLSQLVERPETPTRTHFGSVPDLKLLTTPTETPTPSDSVSLKEDMATSEDDDEESQSESAAEDGLPPDLASRNSVVLENTIMISSPLHTSTQSLHSLHSLYSDGEVCDINSITASPNFSHFTAAFLNVQSDEIEELWRSHVIKVIADPEAIHIINTCQMFPRLYKELRQRMANVTKEACYYISKTDPLTPLALNMLQILTVLFEKMQCPIVYIQPEITLGNRVNERHRFCVLEIQECYDTYKLRKDQVETCLEDIKSQIKQQSLGENTANVCSDEQKLELCRYLYKLHFQLVALYENFTKLLEVFHSAITCPNIPLQSPVSSPQVVDLSLQATLVKSHLNHSLHELENGQVSPVNIETKELTKEDALLTVMEYVVGEKYLKAVQLLRAYRALWPHDVFGQGYDDDIVAIMNIYCRSLAEKRPGVYVMTKVDLDLVQLHSQLLDLHVLLESVSTQIRNSSLSESQESEGAMKLHDTDCPTYLC